MKKLTVEQVKKLSPAVRAKLVTRLKNFLKQDATMVSVFKKYDTSINEIDLIPMCFADIDVSARTDHGIILLNYKLLCDGDFFKDFGYGVHEITHYLQQTTGTKPTKSSDDGSYLDNPNEVEGFQHQIAWLADMFGEGEANEYAEQVTCHHDMEGEEKEEKIDELKEKVEA